MANGRSGLRTRGGHRALRKYVVDAVYKSNIEENMRQYSKKILEPALRSAAYAGIHVFYNEMHRNVPRKEGTLEASLYQWHDDKKSGPLRQVYAMGPNKVKAPHWYNVEFGHWRYNRFDTAGGHWMRSKSSPTARGPGAHDLPGALQTPVWVPASPYIRPTWENAKYRAVQAARIRMGERIVELQA